jgi:hypothetical protein
VVTTLKYLTVLMRNKKIGPPKIEARAFTRMGWDSRGHTIHTVKYLSAVTTTPLFFSQFGLFFEQPTLEIL